MTELHSLLSWVTFVPLAAALLLMLGSVAARGLGADLPARIWEGVGVGSAVFTFAMSLLLWFGLDPAASGAYQFEEFVPWLPEWGIHYHVGIDGISLLLIVLTTFLMPIVLVASLPSVKDGKRSYVFFLLFLETGMLGTFAALSLFQFYLFWELMLVPMYFLIGIWGGPERIRATLKFFLFTMAGSLPMLVAILVLYVLHHQQFGVWTMDLVQAPGSDVAGLMQTAVAVADAPWWQTQTFLFLAFGLAFAIKVPMVPLHTWLPDAHTEAPTAGSVILAGVLLKMGTYGFVRFALPLFPVAAVELAPLVMGLALVGILYGALVAMVQTDLKRLVAYSSVAHLGFVMLGMFALNVTGLEGSVLQMVNHGITTGALFLLVGMLYERRHTHLISEFGGIARPMPVFAALFVITTMASIGLPMLNGFVGEFLVLLGTFESSPGIATAATFGVVLAAVYMLWMVRRVLFGTVEKAENRGLIDLGWRERGVMLLLIVPMFWLGIFPETALRRLHKPVLELIRVMELKTVDVSEDGEGDERALRAHDTLRAALAGAERAREGRASAGSRLAVRAGADH
jgi:NADH-quinone oxidoreductase subunit M